MPHLIFRALLRLLPTELGGRRSPIHSSYHPNWNLGLKWHGALSLNGGQVFLEGREELAPGAEATIRIEPAISPELWGGVAVGAVLPMHEGSQVVGYAVILEVLSRAEHLTPEVAAFVHQAAQFCEFVEKASELPMGARLRRTRERMLKLYEAGANLPHVQWPDGVEGGPRPEPPRDWVGFEKFDIYWEVFDPYEESAPVAGSLSDDVLDVYADVRRGLELWQRRDVDRTAAVWEWRFSFDTHWGDHAVDALRALHRACRDA
ncbi:MAG: DUF5063 domain-containing protein [Myxococcaceae bacterium]